MGFILLRSELVTDDPTIPRLSLDMAVADSQGGIGYIVGNALVSELGRLGHRDRVACLLTQTVVDAADPAFARPTKPIGGFFSAEEARVHQTRDGWVMVEDAGRGFAGWWPPRAPPHRRNSAIEALVAAGFVVIAGGGGGIPVVEAAPGGYRGVEAVMDKDFTSALLGSALGVTVFCSRPA